MTITTMATIIPFRDEGWSPRCDASILSLLSSLERCSMSLHFGPERANDRDPRGKPGRQEAAQRTHQRRGDDLRFEVLFFARSVHLQSPVIDDSLLNVFQRALIRTADKKGTVDGPIEFLCNVAVVSPDFGVIRCA